MTLSGYASILGGKLPVNTVVTRMASLLPCPGFIAQGLDIWHPPIQAWSGEGTQGNFGHIEPVAMFGCMMDRKPFDTLPSLIGRKGLRERADPMRMKIITHQAHPLGFWGVDLNQVSD